MSFVGLNTPSAGELRGAAPPLKEGSKGARNARPGLGRARKLKGGADSLTTPIEQPRKTKYETRRNYMNMGQAA